MIFIVFWPCGPIFFEHVSYYCSFLDPHTTQTNKGVQAIVVLEVGTSTTLRFVLREGFELVNESGMVAFMQIRLPLQ